MRDLDSGTATVVRVTSVALKTRIRRYLVLLYVATPTMVLSLSTKALLGGTDVSGH